MEQGDDGSWSAYTLTPFSRNWYWTKQGIRPRRPSRRHVLLARLHERNRPAPPRRLRRTSHLRDSRISNFLTTNHAGTRLIHALNRKNPTENQSRTTTNSTQATAVSSPSRGANTRSEQTKNFYPQKPECSTWSTPRRPPQIYSQISPSPQNLASSAPQPLHTFCPCIFFPLC